MKLLTFLFLLMPFAVKAQHYTEQYITPGGEKMVIGTRVKIIEGKVYNHISPTTREGAGMKEAFERFLKSDLPGKTYSIDRYTRTPNGKNYNTLAVFTVQNPKLNNSKPVEYFIDIEGALKYNEIEIIK